MQHPRDSPEWRGCSFFWAPPASILLGSSSGVPFPDGEDVFELGCKTLLAYLLGSLIGSLIVGRLRGGVDIRKQGSGNAGGTNALRTQGAAFAAWVMIIDIGKGFLAAAVIPALRIAGPPDAGVLDRDWIAVACAAAVVLGHVYPVWYEFRGGKGAATLVGVLLALNPAALVPVLGTWFLTLVLTGFVGLATVIAAVAFPLYLLASRTVSAGPLFSLGIAMAALVAYTHRTNIARMMAGTENRSRRLWLLGPR